MTHGEKRQPMAGKRRAVATGYETRAFALKRDKSRKRRGLQKAARSKNRGQ
jgi:hypothetical protein